MLVDVPGRPRVLQRRDVPVVAVQVHLEAVADAGDHLAPEEAG